MSAQEVKEPPGGEKDKMEDGITKKIDFEVILLRDLGQFGRFQLRMMLLCIIVAILNAWSSSEFVFTTARITTRCLIPECDSTSPELYPPWVNNAIPERDGNLDNCQRFSANFSGEVGGVGGICPARLFDQNRTENCQEYVYANTNTIVFDFDLACEEWMRTLIGSLRSVGVLLALPLTGFISDRWGRRTALVLNAFNCAWLGTTRYWANTYAGFVASEVIEATFGSGIYTSAYILLIEVTGAKYRTVVSATMSSFFAIGQMTLGLIAWGVPNWRNLTLALYVPQFISIAYLWIAFESVRWCMSKGNYQRAEKVILKLAQINRRTLSTECKDALKKSIEQEQKVKELKKQQKIQEQWLVVLVFQHKKILLRCIIAPVWWVTNTFIYYGLSINAVNMVRGNSYLNYVAVSAIEIPGFWTAVLLVDRIGRKPTLTGGFWICAACQLAYIFIPDGYYGLSLTFYLLGKCAIAVVATTLYIYTSELYPTKYRHSLFGFTSMIGRIGAIIAPLTPAFAASTFDAFPFVLFGSFALLSGILMFLTPETLGTKLPDTLEEAENLEKKENTSPQ